MDEVGFDSAFTFVYSPRRERRPPLDDQVPEDVKRDRMERLVDVVQRVAAARNAARVGCVEVLVEGLSRTDPSLLEGSCAATHRELQRLGGAWRPRGGGDPRRDLDDAQEADDARRRLDGAHRPLGVRRGPGTTSRVALWSDRHRFGTDP